MLGFSLSLSDYSKNRPQKCTIFFGSLMLENEGSTRQRVSLSSGKSFHNSSIVASVSVQARMGKQWVGPDLELPA